MSIKILYIAVKYDYGDPSRGTSYEHENFYKTLIHMFKDVIYFNFGELFRKFGKGKTNQLLWDTVYKIKPDLMFCCLHKDELDKDIIRKISFETNTITFNWFCDDHWRFTNYSKYWAPYFNFVSTTDRDSLTKYKEIGYKNVLFTQWACNHFNYKKVNTVKKYDVTFVGQPHGLRRKWINSIKDSGIDIKYWGYGWGGEVSNDLLSKLVYKIQKVIPSLKSFSDKLHEKKASKLKKSTRISQKEMIRIFNESKINLNLSNSSVESSQQIKGRNFEIPGCGGFLLTNYVKYLENYYDIGKEIVCFDNLCDLKDKINYYLIHKKEREEIAIASYNRTIREHTYERRFDEIFSIMGLN